MPYVWGGTNDKAIGQAHGGFDCSGLVWRALILDPAAPKGMLKKVGGRTTYEMARTTTKARRLSGPVPGRATSCCSARPDARRRWPRSATPASTSAAA